MPSCWQLAVHFPQLTIGSMPAKYIACPFAFKTYKFLKSKAKHFLGVCLMKQLVLYHHSVMVATLAEVGLPKP